MAFLLEETNSEEDNEAADKVMAECTDIRDVQAALIETYRKGTQADKVIQGLGRRFESFQAHHFP